MKTNRFTYYLSVAAALLLTACGGGGGVSDSLEREAGLLSLQASRIEVMDAGGTTPDLLAAFNATASELASMNVSMTFHCGTQKGRQDAYLACAAAVRLARTQR